MLKIERLGFLRLTSSSLQNFRIVCDWIATAYGKAVRFREAERDRVHSDTTLFSHSFLPRQTDYVAVLARRLGFDLSLVTVRLANPDALDEDTLSSVPSVVKDTASEVLRRTDLAFHHTESDFDYALLLPGTTVNQAEIVIGKLRRGLDERLHGRLANARFEFQAEAVHRYQRPALFQDQSAQKGIRNRREY